MQQFHFPASVTIWTWHSATSCEAASKGQQRMKRPAKGIFFVPKSVQDHNFGWNQYQIITLHENQTWTTNRKRHWRKLLIWSHFQLWLVGPFSQGLSITYLAQSCQCGGHGRLELFLPIHVVNCSSLRHGQVAVPLCVHPLPDSSWRSKDTTTKQYHASVDTWSIQYE